jgi:hypothetical protein
LARSAHWRHRSAMPFQAAQLCESCVNLASHTQLRASKILQAHAYGSPLCTIPYPTNGSQAYGFLPRKNKGPGKGLKPPSLHFTHTHALCQLSYVQLHPFGTCAQCKIHYVLRKVPFSKKNITKREHFSHLKMRTGGRSKNPSISLIRDSGPLQSPHFGGARAATAALSTWT